MTPVSSWCPERVPQYGAELRDLTSYRKALVNERSREVNRVHKTLEDAGVKLSSVATDVVGASARAIMQALIGGQADPEVLAELAKGKLPALRKALTARFRGHHAFLLERMLVRGRLGGGHRRLLRAHRGGRRPFRR